MLLLKKELRDADIELIRFRNVNQSQQPTPAHTQAQLRSAEAQVQLMRDSLEEVMELLQALHLALDPIRRDKAQRDGELDAKMLQMQKTMADADGKVGVAEMALASLRAELEKAIKDKEGIAKDLKLATRELNKSQKDIEIADRNVKALGTENEALKLELARLRDRDTQRKGGEV